MTAFTPPLKVHLCWFENPTVDPRCATIARELYAFLHRPIGDDVVLRPGLEIPVEFGRGLSRLLDAVVSRAEPDVEIRLVVAILDAAAFDSADCRAIVRRATSVLEQAVFITIAVDSRWSDELATAAIPPIAVTGEAEDEALRPWVLGADVGAIAGRALLHRFSDNRGPKPRIFVSHAHADGLELAQGIVAHFRRQTRADIWFDETGAERGEDLARELETATDNSIVLVIRTDRYSESPSCALELLAAKRSSAPIVTLLATTDGEPWSSAYGGNHRTMNWHDARAWEVGARCVQAWLHARHFRAYAAAALARAGLPADSTILPRRPELLDLIALGSERRVIVHPDPPLTEGEAALLRITRPAVRLATPTTLLGRVLLVRDPRPPLTGARIAFSLSRARELHWVAEGKVGSGLTVEHLDDTLYSVVLATLSSGARIAHGSVHSDGFTRRLAELHRSHRRLATGTNAQLICFLDSKTEAESPLAPDDFERVDILLPAEAEALPSELRSMLLSSVMRAEMAARGQARVLLGGESMPSRTPGDHGYLGTWPGSLEEAWRTLVTNRALYVIGGFFGAAGSLARMLLSGEIPEELTPAALVGLEARSLAFDEMRRSLRGKVADDVLLAGPGDTLLDVEAIARSILSRWQQFVAGDVKAWANGLSVDENMHLFTSTDRMEITHLVFQGLRKITPRDSTALEIALYFGDIATVPEVDGYAVTVTPGVPAIGASASLARKMDGRLEVAIARSDRPVTLIAGGELIGQSVLIAELRLPPPGQPPAIEDLACQVATMADTVGLQSIACSPFGASLGLTVVESAAAMERGFRAANVTTTRTLVFCEIDRVRYEQLRAQFPKAIELRGGSGRAADITSGPVLSVEALPAAAGEPVVVRSTLLISDPNHPVAPSYEVSILAATWHQWRERFVDFNDSLALGATLWQQLLSAGMRTQLAALDERLVLLTDAEASGLPWELLTDETTRSPACTRGIARRIALTGSYREPEGRMRTNAILRALIIADTRGDLPGAVVEAQTVQSALAKRPDVHIDSIIGPGATIAAVCDRLRGGFYDVLHYAGHAAFHTTDPTKSGLRLQDGVLTGAAVGALTAPRLVFLSACESGRMQHEAGQAPTPSTAGFSIAEAFLRSGTSALVGTFFTVSDASAGSFGATVHAKLATGQTLGSAIRVARRQLYDQKQPDWGNFMLYGDESLVL